MNPNTSRFSAMHARWPMRAAICFALVCSVFWAGNVDAGEYSSDLNSVILRLQEIRDDVDDMLALYHQDYPDLYLYIASISDQANAVLRSIDSAKDSTTGGFNVVLAAAQLETLTSSLKSLDRRMQSLGVGSITNFLGQVDWDEFKEALALQFSKTFGEDADAWFNYWATANSWFSYVGSGLPPYIAVGSIPFSEDGSPIFHADFGQSLGEVWFGDIRPDFEEWFSALSGSSNGVQSATTNLLTTQNLTLERVAEYVAGVSNAVGTISNEYDTDPTGSNDLPSAEKPKELVVEKSVDTSSLEEAVQQTFDGLDSLTPSGSSTVPEIMIRDAYRGEDAIKVRLDLSEIGIATRICKACWAILLAVGVLGIVRSEWDYWTTLGGSAT